MKALTLSTRQMVEFLAISFITAIYLAPAVRAAPYLPSRPPPTTTTTAAISHHRPSAHETPQDVLLVEPIFGNQVRTSTSTSVTATASVSVAASFDLLGPSPTTTSTAVLKKRYIYYTKVRQDEQKEGKKENTPWSIKDSVDKVSGWLNDQKDKILAQVDKITSKDNTRYGGGGSYRSVMNPLPLVGNDDDDELPQPSSVPVKLETIFQHPENATQAERFRNALLLEAPSQVKPGDRVNVDFSTVRSTINGVNGAEYYGYGSGNGYGYSYGSVAAGVFVVALLWMLVRRRPGMFGSGFPCSRPAWVGCLAGRWKGRRGVGGLEGGQVEEVQRGWALLRED